jgi:predicted AlkP superfamily phosphohydrolase/phosphomutase
MTSQTAMPSNDAPEPASRVLLLGLDGATWTLLDPLIEKGILPVLASLISDGARGVLESPIPPVTASAWSSLYTGRTPGGHGVFDFRRRMGPDSTNRPWVTPGSIGGPKIWDILSAQGKSVGLLNLPLTFPPVRVNGYMIGGMPVPRTRDDIGFPEGIVDEITREIGEYISDVDLLRGKSPDVGDPEKCVEFVDEVGRAAESRGRAAVYLMDKYPADLTACVFVTPDRLSHLFWKILVPEPSDPADTCGMCVPHMEKWETELKDRMIEVLGRMDRIVGKLIDKMSENDLVILVSDHGFGPLDELLKLNILLRDLGYLQFRPEVDRSIRKKVGRLLPESVKKPLRTILGMNIQNKRDGESKPFDPYALINWADTRAYSGGSVEQGIFINVVGREPEGTVQMGAEYHDVRDRLIAELREVTHPSDGKPLFDWVETRENVYSGEFLEYAPDIMFSLRGYRMVVGEDAEPPMIGPWSQPRAGFHRRDGIVVMKGPMIQNGVDLEKSGIADIAPTILACMGLAADEGMNGKIIHEAIDPIFLDRYPLKTGKFEEKGRKTDPSDSDASEMEDLLKGLGYLN